MFFGYRDDLHIAVHRKKLNSQYCLWGVIDALVMAALFMVAIKGEEPVLGSIIIGLILMCHIVLKSHFETVDIKLNNLYEERLASGEYGFWLNNLEESWNKNQEHDDSFTTYIVEYCEGIKLFTLFHLIVVVVTFYLALPKWGLAMASIFGILSMLVVIIDYKVFKKLLVDSFENHTYRRPRK